MVAGHWAMSGPWDCKSEHVAGQSRSPYLMALELNQ